MNGTPAMSKNRNSKPSRPPGKNANKMVRDTIAKEKRRRRTIISASIAAAVLILGGLIGYGLYETQKPKQYVAPSHATADSGGVIAGGSGKVRVDLYIDYQCPVCRHFEADAADALDQMVAKNQITLAYHPVAFLDRMSSTQYSTRSAASAGCASDRGQFLPYTKALFKAQPAEGSKGLSDDQLVQIAGQVGIIDPKFAECVRSGKYKDWVAHVTDSAAAKNVNGTPTVLVNGKSISATGAAPTLDDLTGAVNSARGVTPAPTG
jgi:protein-disulfide isomerase